MIKLNEQMADKLFNCRSPNARQASTLKQFGIHVRRNGWFKQLINLEISEALYVELLDCKGRRPPGFPKKQWRKACVPAE